MSSSHPWEKIFGVPCTTTKKPYNFIDESFVNEALDDQEKSKKIKKLLTNEFTKKGLCVLNRNLKYFKQREDHEFEWHKTIETNRNYNPLELYTKLELVCNAFYREVDCSKILSIKDIYVDTYFVPRIKRRLINITLFLIHVYE